MTDILRNISKVGEVQVVHHLVRHGPQKAALPDKYSGAANGKNDAHELNQTNSAAKLPKLGSLQEESIEIAKKANIERALEKQFSFDIEKSQLRIAKDQETGRFIYKTVDRESGEVIRQFPADEILKLLRSVKSETGFLVDNSV